MLQVVCIRLKVNLIIEFISIFLSRIEWGYFQVYTILIRIVWEHRRVIRGRKMILMFLLSKLVCILCKLNWFWLVVKLCFLKDWFICLLLRFESSWVKVKLKPSFWYHRFSLFSFDAFFNMFSCCRFKVGVDFSFGLLKKLKWGAY